MAAGAANTADEVKAGQADGGHTGQNDKIKPFPGDKFADFVDK